MTFTTENLESLDAAVEQATTTRSPEEMLTKIRKLLDTAESFAEKGNIEAADSYVAKAHELQQRYAITSAMLEEEGKAAEVKIIDREIIIDGSYGNRRQDLVNGIAKATGCTGYYSSRTINGIRHYRYVVFGYPADVEWVETLYHSLTNLVDIEMKWAKREWRAEQAHLPKWHRENGRTFAVAFMAGFVEAVSSRLRAEKQKAEREAQAKIDEEYMSTHLREGHSGSVELVEKPGWNNTMVKSWTASCTCGWRLTGLYDETQACRTLAGHRAPKTDGSAPTSTSVALVIKTKEKRVDDEMRARVRLTNRYSTSSIGSASGYGKGKAAGARAPLAKGSVNRGASRGRLGGGS